jgi:hypothetical protein
MLTKVVPAVAVTLLVHLVTLLLTLWHPNREMVGEPRTQALAVAEAVQAVPVRHQTVVPEFLRQLRVLLSVALAVVAVELRVVRLVWELTAEEMEELATARGRKAARPTQVVAVAVEPLILTPTVVVETVDRES